MAKTLYQEVYDYYNDISLHPTVTNPGGSLAMLLENTVADTATLLHCISRASEEGDTEGARIGNLLLPLTEQQRLDLVIQLHDLI